MPLRDLLDPSLSGGESKYQFRRRIRNIVDTYRDARADLQSRGINEAAPPARLVEDRLAEEETLNKVDAKDVSNVQGEEKLVLYPTYAARPYGHHLHIHPPGTQHCTSDIPEMLTTVELDVHVHGHVSIPHAPGTPLSRKDRILLSVARQISGLPPLSSTNAPGPVKKKSLDIIRKMSGRSSGSSGSGTVTPSIPSPTAEKPDPLQSTARPGSMTGEQLVDEPDLINLDSPNGSNGGLSRTSSSEKFTLNHAPTFPSVVIDKTKPTRVNTIDSAVKNPKSTSVKPESAWKNSHIFPQLDLETCHANLTSRLAPFIARSVSNQRVTVKVFAPMHVDSTTSIIAERDFRTNEYGHFAGRLRVRSHYFPPPESWNVEAALHPPRGSAAHGIVRREVTFISDQGVSLISDIDDTVKNTAILAGARELFRNTFVRDLSSMSIEGVREWYGKMVRMGAQVHYVSNSPYQCWPIIQSFIDTVGLPMGGSVHLKQYSGMISGIMENAADKKRAGVENIIRDFPYRKFVLIGDSGEQDLELYTEMALNYPNQILGIFIRDVTTPLLSRNSGNSNSTISLPAYFNDNQQSSPARKETHVTRPKSIRDSWRTKSQDTIPTMSSIGSTTTPSSSDDSLPVKDFESLTLKEMEPLASLYFKSIPAEEDSTSSTIATDLPLRQTKTPPPLPVRPTLFPRTQSSTSITSEPTRVDPMRESSPTPSQFLSRPTSMVDEPTPSSRVKRVEQWKRRLAGARERLLVSGCDVEIWTWRVGQDVEGICESLVLKGLREGEGEDGAPRGKFGLQGQGDTRGTNVSRYG